MTSTAASFPSSAASLCRPSPTALHTVHHHSADYNNYSDTFSAVTAYDNSNRSAELPTTTQPLAPLASALGRNNSTRQIEAFGNKFLNAISESVKAPPAAAGLSRTQSLHARARSLVSLVPSLTASSVEEQKGSSSTRPRHPRAVGSIFGANTLARPSTGYLPEESEVEEQEQQPQDYYPFIMEYKSTLTGGDRPAPLADRRPSHTGRQPSAGASSIRKFNWFGSLKHQQPVQPVTGSQAQVASDDAHLVQPAASLLLPHGNPDPQDPSSFTDLLKNAEALITKLQTAYAQQETAIKTARQEREAAAEEAEEADTRARHLKFQLDGMGKRANEQDLAMKAMAEELAEERRKRVAENERWERLHRSAQGGDEHTPKRRSFRNSGASSNSMSSMASDSGFESDYYAETETDASTSSRPMTPLYERQRWDVPAAKETIRPTSRGSLQDRTCQVDVAVWTWMREEKGRLEKRVKELEGVVDGCLDLVSQA